MESHYKIKDIAEITNVTKRTIRYYIAKGLIPPPEGEGLASVYSENHINRIKLVKKLQGEYYPLIKIEEMISSLDDEQIKNMLENEIDKNIVKQNYIKSNNDITGVTEYIKIDLGQGIYLCCSSEDFKKKQGIIKNIKNYALKLFSA